MPELKHNFVNGECTVCGESEEWHNLRHGNAEPSDKDLPVVAQPSDNDSSTTYPWNNPDSGGMSEQQLLERLCEIRDEADNNGRYKIKRMLNKLMLDRWGHV